MSEKSKESTTKQKEPLGKGIIAGIITGAVVLIGIVVCVVLNIIVANQPLEQDWAQAYYEYLREHRPSTTGQDSDGNDYDVAEYETGFYDVEGLDDPILVMSYIDGDGNKQLTYYYQRSGEIAWASYAQGSDLQLLYDIDRKAYDYYVHQTTNDGVETYTRVVDAVEAMSSEASEPAKQYTFKADEVAVKVTKEDGTELKVTKFEQKFVPVESKVETKRLPVDYDDSALKETVREDSEQISWLDKVSQENIERINKVIADIEQRKTEIEQVQKEAEEKAAAEAAAKAAEEEARKGLKLEGKTVTYGTYRWTENGYVAGTVIINRDGTCMYNEEQCTWSIGKRDYAQSLESKGKAIHESIMFKWGSQGYVSGLYAYRDNEIGDGDIADYKLIKAQD